MNYALLENVQALLDYHEVPRTLDSRVDFLTQQCGLNPTDSKHFLIGERNLPNGEVRKIADKFEVDLRWLVGKG